MKATPSKLLSKASRLKAPFVGARTLSPFGGKALEPPAEDKQESEVGTLIGKRTLSLADIEEKSQTLEDGENPSRVVQTCTVELTLNMSKEVGKDKVKVQIKDIEVGESTFRSADLAKKALSSTRMRSMIEAAISQVAGPIFSKKLKKMRASARQRTIDKIFVASDA